MINTNCPNCDRADCPTLTLPFVPSVGLADCANHTVNWRARALTETARADAAEARIADASREARLIISQATADSWWRGAKKAAKILLARLEPKP